LQGSYLDSKVDGGTHAQAVRACCILLQLEEGNVDMHKVHYLRSSRGGECGYA